VTLITIIVKRFGTEGVQKSRSWWSIFKRCVISMM